MVTPDRQDMDVFLRAYVGANAWRTPRALWRRMHHSKAGILLAENRIPKLRKYQRGNFNVFPAGTQQLIGPSTLPNMQDIANATSQTAPTPDRQQYAYDSDGGIEWDEATTEAGIVYSTLTTGTDDANNHSNDWWPDQPETNIGLDYDIRYLNAVIDNHTGAGSMVDHLLADNTGTDRTTDVWYLLDTVSNDHVDASHDGGIGCNRPNGGGKSPNVGISTFTCDVEIRSTGSGSALTSMSFDLDCQGT
jgi:hypothetical protein